DDAGDKYVSDVRQFLFDARAGADGACPHRDKAEMFFGSQGGIHCDDERAGMLPFYFVERFSQIEGMHRILERSVHGKGAWRLFCKLIPDKWPQAVSGNTVAANTEENQFVPG